MMQAFGVEVLVPIASFIFVFLTVKAFLDYRNRQKLIEKGLVDENIKYLFAAKQEGPVSPSLKWGLVLIAIGVAVFIGQTVKSEKAEEITIGAMFTLAGLALLLYYAIANRAAKKSKAENSGNN